MAETIYTCPECGKESKEDEFVSRRRNMVHCPACGQFFVINEVPIKPNLVKKVKK